jgi:hypothetical protein
VTLVGFALLVLFNMSLGPIQAAPNSQTATPKPNTLNISISELNTALKPAFVPSGKGIKKFKTSIADNQLLFAIILNDSRAEATIKYSIGVADGRLVGVLTGLNLTVPLEELSKPGFSPRVITEIAHLDQRAALNQRVNEALQKLVQKKARSVAPVLVQSAAFARNRLVVIVLK